MTNDRESDHDLKRDPAIELARFIGCLIVIGCHTYLSTKVNGQFDKCRLFFGMLFADGVAVFWLIGGAFLFNNTDYKRLLVRRTKQTLLPMLLVGLLYLLSAAYSDGNRSIRDLIINEKERYLFFLKNLLLWRNGFPAYEHSWYIYVYMLLVLAFPALKGVVTYTDRAPKRKYVLVCGILAFLAINDLSRNQLASFDHHMFNGLSAAAFITFIGYYLYQSRSFFQRKRYLVIAPAVFLMMNLTRETVQLHRESAGYGDDISIMYWYSVFGVIAASCILIFCIALIPNRRATMCNKLICNVASYTFPIYLIHVLIYRTLERTGLTGRLQNGILAWNSGAAGESVYMLLIVSCVFWSSFIAVYILRLIYTMCMKYIKSHKTKGAPPA